LQLVRALPPLKRQIDALLAFDASSSELFNGVVLAAYVLLYKDLIRLYAIYFEAMINIIGMFFSMSKKDCQESLRIYKAFLKRVDHVNHFIQEAVVSLLSVTIQLPLKPSKHQPVTLPFVLCRHAICINCRTVLANGR
uniref:ANTH domain-containing protein n=1 Tax=Taenia asiatica TaxID=60517 RepID=A0A0R3WFP1_TAEAS